MARSTLLTIVIAGASGVAGALLVSSLRARSEGDRLALPPEAIASRRGPAGPLAQGRTDDRRDDVHAPVVEAEKLLELERRIAALEESTAQDQRHDGQADRPRSPEPERRSTYYSLTPDEQNAARRDEIALIRALLSSETPDPAWSADAERSIRDSFASLPATLGPPAALECGGTFCAFELEYESIQTLKENADHAGLPAPLGGPSRTAVELIPGGHARLHVFLGRPGYSLPTAHAE